MDAIEGQNHEQVNEAKVYAPDKSSGLDAKLCAELDKAFLMVMSDLETKVESRVKNLEVNLAAQAKLNDPNKLTVLEAKFKERIDGLDQSFKAHLHFTEQHQAYLKAQVKLS